MRVGSIAICVVAIGMVWGASARAEESIKIGLITARSGAFALYATSAEKGEILAAEEINKAGGVHGRKIEFLTGDSKSSPEEASRLYREFSAKNVSLIIGNVGSAETAAISALAREAKIPTFATVGYARSLTEELGHTYFFRPIVNSRAFARPLAERLAKQKYKAYCTINNDYTLGHDVNADFLEALKKLRPDVAVLPGCDFWVPLSTTDFTSYITAILSKRPDAVVFSGLVGPSGRAFISQAKSFGLFKMTAGAHASIGWPGNNAGLRKQDVPENLVTATDYPYPPLKTPNNIKFFDAFKARWSELPLSEGAYGYATMHFVAKVFEKDGNENAVDFVKNAASVTYDHPAAGPLKFRPFDNQVNMGVWIGTLAWDAQDERPGMEDIEYVPGDAYLPSESEVERLRTAKGK